MHLSNSSKYAIRIMSYITNNSKKELVSAREIAEKLSIPYKFLTKIMVQLVKADFIVSIRGKDGGYKLSRSATEITVLDILNQFNEFINQDECILGIGTCNEKNKCSLHDQWIEPKNMIQKMFKETTLENLDGINRLLSKH